MCLHIVRDTFSGIGLAFPTRKRTCDVAYRNFKFFGGLKAKSPNIIVKSDAAPEILGAVDDLGWHRDPSLENTWPHNTRRERYIGKLKGVTRAAMFQSAVPGHGWDCCGAYASTALSITEPAPILPHERNAAGQVLDLYAPKNNQTAWECFHNGAAFEGPIEPFGRLCFYRDPTKALLTEQASPVFFHGMAIGARP